MSEKELDLIERYLNEVTRRVPKEQREDIYLELKALINDMCENASVEEVLTKLGDPARLASQYRDETKYVISPEYYDQYLWVLKLVFLGVGISVLVSAIVDGISRFSSTDAGTISAFSLFISYLFSSLINNLLASGISAFGATTLIFAVLERQKVKVDIKNAREWTLDHLSANAATSKVSWTPGVLPPVPDKRAVIKRSDSIIGIIFLTVFAVLFLWAPDLFGIYLLDDAQVIQGGPIFNLAIWSSVMPFFLILFLCGLLNECIRLVTGYYCKTVLISTILLDTIQVVISFIVFKLFPIWNTQDDLMGLLSSHFDLEITSRQDILFYWNTDAFSNIILGIVCFATVLEISITAYKTLRYGKH